MENKFVRVAAATPKIQLANPSYNANVIIELMRKARDAGVKLLCFPEACITGCTCGNLLLRQTLQESAEAALLKIIEASKEMDMVITVGLTKEYVAFANGRVLCRVPNYEDMDITHECMPGVNAFKGYYYFPLAGIPCPIIIQAYAQPEIIGSAEYRRREAWDSCAGYIVVGAGYGESTTDGAYSGHNIIAHKGKILAESPPFGDGWVIADIPFEEAKDRIETFELPKNDSALPFVATCTDYNEPLNIQAAGLATRLDHTNSKTAVIGISGGLDSCLALLVAVRAFEMLGRDVSGVYAVTMPCFGTTAHTKANAHHLCVALGIHCHEIDITPSVTQHLQDINHPKDIYDVTFENAQARMRTMVLMNIANQQNGIVVGTGSLSELALGWATYNGDHMSMYAVNAGVPKTLVRHTVALYATACQNTQLKKVLESILATKVSPELLPTPQHTEDLVGPYQLHDFFIYHMLVCRREPKEIFERAKAVFDGAYTSAQILHWQKVFYTRFFSQQFKRNCMPDAPQVVDISLSPRRGLNMPSDAHATAWLAQLQGLS